MDNFRRKHWDAAGTMFRKTLETALKKIDHTQKKEVGNKDEIVSLKKRINDLSPECGVTPAMKQWAHEIRELGADAAHEEDPFTEKEATDLQAFTELFLTYTFTLPGMLEDRRSPKQIPETHVNSSTNIA